MSAQAVPQPTRVITHPLKPPPWGALPCVEGYTNYLRHVCQLHSQAGVARKRLAQAEELPAIVAIQTP
jgi:hypothetical protein